MARVLRPDTDPRNADWPKRRKPGVGGQCGCGSGKPRRALVDARGIFCAYVCDACEQRVRRRYRPEIFMNPGYWADEPIEEDDDV